MHDEGASPERRRRTRLVIDQGRRVGFEIVGVAPLADTGQAPRLREWLDRGMHAEMRYMERDPDGRADPTRGHPWARSMICLGRSHFRPVTAPRQDRGRVALHATGLEDYHDWMKRDLEAVGRFLGESLGARSRVAVDSSPILERPHAVEAGLGWIGKNTLVVSPRLGSFFFLGEILTDLDLEPARVRRRHRCGSCSRCIDLCPTQAIVRPHLLDSRLCISYLTIEHRGVIDRGLRPLIGNWIFGCDVCQAVCPWNKFAPATTAPEMAPRSDLTAPELAPLMRLTQAEFRRRYRSTPIWRAHRDGLLRNVAIALGNSRAAEALAPLEQGLHDEAWLVRLHSAWGLARAGAGMPWAVPARSALQEKLETERDARVREEIEWGMEKTIQNIEQETGNGILAES